jgi:hypothetical protein
MIMLMLKVLFVSVILFIVDIGFDSALKTGHLDGQYIFRDAWLNTGRWAIVIYALIVIAIAAVSSAICGKLLGGRSNVAVWLGAVLCGMAVICTLRYALHLFTTIT